jgi:hypothetical protein
VAVVDLLLAIKYDLWLCCNQKAQISTEKLRKLEDRIFIYKLACYHVKNDRMANQV